MKSLIVKTNPKYETVPTLDRISKYLENRVEGVNLLCV